VAGAAGILAAYGSVRVLLSLAPADLPRLDEITIDGAVMFFAVCLNQRSPRYCSDCGPPGACHE